MEVKTPSMEDPMMLRVVDTVSRICFRENSQMPKNTRKLGELTSPIIEEMITFSEYGSRFKRVSHGKPDEQT